MESKKTDLKYIIDQIDKKLSIERWQETYWVIHLQKIEMLNGT